MIKKIIIVPYYKNKAIGFSILKSKALFYLVLNIRVLLIPLPQNGRYNILPLDGLSIYHPFLRI